MIVRSLRWRLGIAMALLIGALAVAAGLFSSITVKREFDRYLVSQRLDEVRSAQELLVRAPDVVSGLREVYERYGMRGLVFDDRRRVVALYPPSMSEYRVVLHPGGRLEMTSGFEKLVLKGAGRRIKGKGTVVFLPPQDRERRGPQSFRVSVDRGLLAGLAAAAILAVLVVLTIFRRVFAPVEALTRGARALASGRLERASTCVAGTRWRSSAGRSTEWPRRWSATNGLAGTWSRMSRTSCARR